MFSVSLAALHFIFIHSFELKESNHFICFLFFRMRRYVDKMAKFRQNIELDMLNKEMTAVKKELVEKFRLLVASREPTMRKSASPNSRSQLCRTS